MLVGRDRELDALRTARERAAMGAGNLVVIIGAPGLGKTRLADEASADAADHGFAVHWGRAWETGGAPAYWPWAQILSSIARSEQGALPPALTPIIARGERHGVGDGRRADPGEARFALFEAVSGFLREAAAATPLGLVLDDLHAADVPSLELLAFVARGLRASRVLLLGTWRDIEARLPAVAEPIERVAREATLLRLAPLGRDDVRSLLRSAHGSGDDALAATVHQRTEGNPLFVHEALQLLASGGEGRLALLAGSESVAAVIRRRVANLGAEGRAVLPAASVLGREIAPELLVDLLGLPELELEQRLEALAAAGVLERRAGSWAFSHVLVREALYDELSATERRELHARVVDAIERRIAAGAESLVAPCAHHALAAVPALPADEALSLALRAAARARSQLAYEDAVTLLESAQRLADRVQCEATTKFEIALALGWAALEAGRPEPARAAFDAAGRVARHLASPNLLARAALGRGAEFVLGDVREDLVAMLREALAMLPPDELPLRARLNARLSAALVPGPETTAAFELARSAIESVREHPDDRLVLEVAVSAGSALATDAGPGECIAINRELVHRARRVGDRVHELRGLSRLVCDFLESGDLAHADATLAMRDELARALKLPRYQWPAPLFRSMRAMIDGDFVTCDAAVARAQALGRDAGDDNAARAVAMHRTWLLLLQDRSEELRAFLPEAMRAVDSMSGAHVFHAVLPAIVHARLGELDAARRAIESIAIEELYGHGVLVSATLAEAVSELDDRARMPALIERLRPHVERNGTWGLFGFVSMPSIAAYLGRLQAMVGRREEAERSFAMALDRARSMRAAPHEAWIRYWWGRAKPDRAAEMLREAESLASGLGMERLASRAREARGELPSPPPVARTTPADPPRFRLRQEGDGWAIEHGGSVFKLRALRGLAMIAQLVERPGVEMHAAALAAGPAAEGDVADRGDAGEMLDEQAKRAYKQRLVALRDELEEAQALGQLDRAERAHEEMEALSRELARAIGLGGRARRAGSNAERARSNVQRRVREAIRRIADLDPVLGRHLDGAVRTGTFCVYEPERVR